jgi:hypothetical protein
MKKAILAVVFLILVAGIVCAQNVERLTYYVAGVAKTANVVYLGLADSRYSYDAGKNFVVEVRFQEVGGNWSQWEHAGTMRNPQGLSIYMHLIATNFSSALEETQGRDLYIHVFQKINPSAYENGAFILERGNYHYTQAKVYLRTQQQPTPAPAPTTRTTPTPAPAPTTTPAPTTQPSQPQQQQNPQIGSYQGSWKGRDNTWYTLIITNNEFRLDIGFAKLTFTIDSWEAVSNPNSATNRNFPSGYRLNGRVSAQANYSGVRSPIYVYLHNDGQSLIWRSDPVRDNNTQVYVK